MSTTTRIICVLVWVDGYSAAEVAGILEMSDSAVRGAIKRARDTLLHKKLGGGAA
jgi:DNA-directed RNA polymerase specialized sigma24 family protein